MIVVCKFVLVWFADVFRIYVPVITHISFLFVNTVMKRLDAPFFYWDTPYTLYGTALLL